MNRAYTVLDVKEIVEREDDYFIRGIASTPSVDRIGDVVEPLGARFKTPMPLLWQHKSDKPVGLVTFAKPTKNGIPFEATLPNIKEQGTLKDRVDEAIQSLKYRLVAAVSIGFQPVKDKVEQLKGGGLRFLEWDWIELSLVTIPANAEATITSIKSLDEPFLRAASGRNAETTVVRLDSSNPGVPGAIRSKPKDIAMKTIREQIEAFEAKRAATLGRMDELMSKSAETGSTLDETETQEYDGAAAEIKSIDEHLVRLKEHEARNLAAAKPVEKEAGVTPSRGTETRSGIISVRSNVEKGIPFARYVKALAMANGNPMYAQQIAEANKGWMDTTPQVAQCLKAAVGAGTSTASAWADDLVYNQNLVGDFIEYLRPATIIGRVPGLRRVPFNVRVGSVTSGGTAYWVGQGAPIPLSKLQTGDVTLDRTKAAGMMSITEELARDSSPSAEMLVRDDLRDTIAQFLDRRFVDPSWAAVANVSPASITNGVTAVSPTGTTAAALRTDIATLMGNFITNDIPTTGGVWIMTETTALAISMMTNSFGQPEFRDINPTGGMFLGYPVVVSQSSNVSGSPTVGNLIIFAIAREIMLADEGGVDIQISNQASLQMDDAPTNNSATPTATSLVSMFQTNSIAIRAIRYINWKKRRTDVVQYISNALYAA